MILDEHLMERAKRYCAVVGIPTPGGYIPRDKMEEVLNFLRMDQRNSRRESKRLEVTNKIKCSVAIPNVMNKLKVESPIEEVLRDAFVVEGLHKHLRTQFQIGTKRVDFAFPIVRLVVEADGAEFHRENQLQIDRDMDRDKYLARKGWRVLHIEGVAIRRNLKLCMDKIKAEIGPL